MSFDESYNFLTTFFNSIREKNFSDDEIFNLCKQSINETRIHPNEEAINRAEALVVTGLLHEQKLLTSYTFQYKNWDNSEAVIVLCKKLENIFSSLTCDYTNALERYKFCARAFDFFAWMLDGIRYSIVILDPLAPSIQTSIKYLIKALKEFTSKPFFLLLIYTYIHHSRRKINKEILLSHAQAIVKEKEKYMISEDGKADFLECINEIPKIVQKVIDGPRAGVMKTNYSILPESHPGVLTLGTIFSCFNVTESDLEVAETMLIFSHTVGISRTDLIFDILQIGPLIQAQDNNSQRNSLIEVFVYLRVPNILKLLIFELGVKKESLLAALKKFVKARSLLNNVDLQTKSHLVQHCLKCFQELNLINIEESENLLKIRNAEILENEKLAFLLDDEKPPSDDSSLRKVQLAEQITSIIRKFMAQEDEKFLAVVEKFLLTTDGMMERVMAVMCATDELRDFALRLAKINQTCENHLTEMGPLRHNRLHVFDTTFLLLIRIKYVFKDLRITLTHPELEQSRFFSWWSVYEKGLLENSPLTTTENKEIFLTQYNILKQSKPFWNDTDEVGSIIDNIPGIGDLILDDFRRGWVGVEKSIESMMLAFQQFPCIFVCFIQWLETQRQDIVKGVDEKAITPMSDNIRDFSRKVIEICKETLPKPQPKSWAFAIYAIDTAIQHLTNRTPDAPYHVKSFLLTIAHRVMPKTHFMQAPDKLELKDAYYIATQQGYATPDVIELCSNAIQTLNFRKWILCWLEQLMKNNCSDELLSASELILATLFLRPATVLAEITQRLMDLMLQQTSNKLNLSNQACPRIFAWLVVRAQTLLIFAEQIRREKENAKKLLREKSQQDVIEMMTSAEINDEDDVEPPPAKKSRKNENVSVVTEDESSNFATAAATEDSQMGTTTTAATSKTTIANEIIAAIEKEQSITIFDDDKSFEIRQDFELDDEPMPVGSNVWQLSKRIHQINEDAFMNLSDIIHHSKSMSIITISLSLRRIEKQIKVPFWRNELLFTVHFARELARVPRSRFWYKLVYVLAKPQFFQQLARIEPYALTLDDMLRLYDIRDPEQLEHICYYALLLRRFKAI